MDATTVETWDLSDTGTSRWYIRLFPCLTDLAFLLPAFLIFNILSGAKSLLGDGDTGWHIRTGDWILLHRTVPTADLFSFTKPHQTWFAWEWLWDVLFSLIHRFWGLAGVAFINILLLSVISALLFRLVRRCSGNDVLSLAFTIVAVCGSSIHWLARPHLFSWLFILIFSHVILSAEAGKRTGLWLLPFITVLWTNLHGGFFVGIILLLTSAVGQALQAATEQDGGWRTAYTQSRAYLFCAVGCGVATFINPYTWHLHQHVYRYLLDTKLLDNIQEYQSVDFRRGGALFFEPMLLLGVASVLWCLQKRKVTAAISIVLWAHLALVSQRNIPLFFLIATPWAAYMAQDVMTRLRSVSWLRTFSHAVSEVGKEFHPLERVERWHAVSLLAVLFVATSFASGKPGFRASFDAKTFPVDAVAVLQDTHATRVFTYDQWGDYLIYRLYPSGQVFMDGRSDFYGAEFVTEYQHILSARYDWELYLNRFAVDTVMVKPDAPVATVLKQCRNWKLVFDNGFVIVFRADRGTNGTLLSGRTRISSVSHDGGK